MTSPAVDPPTFVMSITETFPLTFDASAYLSGGQSIASLTSTLVNVQNSRSIALANAATASGNIVTQRIEGPTDLKSPGKYLLTINFNASPAVTIWAMELLIVASV